MGAKAKQAPFPVEWVLYQVASQFKGGVACPDKWTAREKLVYKEAERRLKAEPATNAALLAALEGIAKTLCGECDCPDRAESAIKAAGGSK